MADSEQLVRENDSLRKEIEHLRRIISGYENVLKLNEKELENADEIIKMYENIVEFTRVEMKDMTETAKAREVISAMSRNELIEALNKIHKLDEQNKLLREKKSMS